MCIFFTSSFLDIITRIQKLQSRENNALSGSNQNNMSCFSRKISVSISYEERQICYLEEIISHSESSERSNKFLAYYLVSTGTSHSTSSYLGIANERWLSGVQTLHFLDAARIRLSPCFVRRMSRTVARTRKDKPTGSSAFLSLLRDASCG